MRADPRFLALLIAVPTLLAAQSVRDHFQVSARVVPKASITPVAAPARVEITADDLRRGYKDVAATYRVETNDQRGYLLRFNTRAGLTDAIEVRGLAAPVRLDDLGADVMQSAPPPRQDYRLQFRLQLAPTAQPGSYELPVVVGVATL